MAVFTVKLRRSEKFKIMPDAEQIDGKTFTFLEGWIAEPDDFYANEQTWIPYDQKYPIDAPAWLAEGDLVAVV